MWILQINNPAPRFLVCLRWSTRSSPLFASSCLLPGFCYNSKLIPPGHLIWLLLGFFCPASTAPYSPTPQLCSDDIRSRWASESFKGILTKTCVTIDGISIPSLLAYISKHWGDHTYNMALGFSSCSFCFLFFFSLSVIIVMSSSYKTFK